MLALGQNLMSDAPIMPFFTDAYLADCHHLSTEAHGALLLILLHTWRAGGKPLADDERMRRIVKARSARKWVELKSELAPLFDLSEGTWRQKKLERTWADVEQKISQARKNGKQGLATQKARKSLAKKEAHPADATDPPPLSMNHEPLNHEPVFIIKDEIMLNPSSHLPSVALDSLSPVLRDANYFVPDRKSVV